MVITAILQAQPGLFADVENEHRVTTRMQVYWLVATADQQGNCGIQPVTLIDGKFYVGGKNIRFGFYVGGKTSGSTNDYT